ALRVRVLGCHPERRTCSMKRSRSTGVRRLVFRWLLEAIYNQDRCCRLLRLQLQAKLLLNGVEERRLTRSGRAGFVFARTRLAISPMQVEVIAALQASLVYDWSAQLARELLREIVGRDSLRSNSIHLIPADFHSHLLLSHVHGGVELHV